MGLFKHCLFLFSFVSFVFAAVFWGVRTKSVTTKSVSARPVQGYTLILDAGHGGEDGGAVSRSGISESVINLDVTRRLDLLLGLFGVPGVMLREEDTSLHDPSARTLREKKVSDLKNRVSAIEGEAGAWLISIHQNTFPDARYHGAQVFYAPTDGSQALAEAMQDTLRTTLDPENQRECKLIPDSIYLMNHISCPAVLVECGFLSNQQEERLLVTPAYQVKLAAALAGGWLSYQSSITRGACTE